MADGVVGVDDAAAGLGVEAGEDVAGKIFFVTLDSNQSRCTG